MKVWAVLVVGALLLCQTLAEDRDERVGAGHGKRVHPCSTKECGEGYECDLDEDSKPVCVCVQSCPDPGEVVQVCSTQNRTYESECEFYRQKCLCKHKNPECTDRSQRKAILDYYGPCKEMKVCEDEELEDFPHRMREWLYYVMEELDKRNDLNAGAHRFLMEAKMAEHHWVLPVIWKFCDLDTTFDRYVNTEELMPISAPLKPLEQCTAPFLEKCDDNDDGTITLQEWGKCLGLDPDEIRDRCDELRD